MHPEKRFVYERGVFPTLEEAVAACKRIVDEQLEEWAKRDDIIVKELHELYMGCGDDPYILPADGTVPADGTDFSASDYAYQRGQALANRNAHQLT